MRQPRQPESVEAATTKGVKRGARFRYRASPLAIDSGLSNGVFLEIGSRGRAMPTSTMTIRSVLAEHAAADIAGNAEAESFDARVLRPSRTLVEKLVLLHTASCDSNPATLIRGARHYYEIHQLLARPDVLDEVREVGIAILARDVVTYSTAAALAAEQRPNHGFAACPAFADGPHLDCRTSRLRKQSTGRAALAAGRRPVVRSLPRERSERRTPVVAQPTD